MTTPKKESGEPPHPNEGAGARADFARVSIMPGLYVVRAEEPITYMLGTTFRSFKITYERAQAPVFVAARAREIQQGLVRMFPSVELEPATFEEWVEQQAG